MNNFKTVEMEQIINTPDYADDELISSELFGVIYSLGRDAESEEEYQYALNLLLSLCDRKAPRVRAYAILGISLLAMNHGYLLERERIEPIIKNEYEAANEENKPTIQDAIRDINYALKWNILNVIVDSIWLEFENWETPHDENDCNSDVGFQLSDGTEWIASFFTYQNIMSLHRKNKETGECLGGLYFCATDMILIEKMDRESILKVIEQMIINNEIEVYCQKINSKK